MLGWLQLHPINSKSIGPMKMAIAAAVILTALGMFFQKPFHALGKRLRTSNAARFTALPGPFTVARVARTERAGDGALRGAGTLGAVFLVYLYPLRLTPPRLIAIDIVDAIPLAMFAGVGHLLMGNVNLGLLGKLLVGSTPAVMVGAMLWARLPHALLRGA